MKSLELRNRRRIRRKAVYVTVGIYALVLGGLIMINAGSSFDWSDFTALLVSN